MTVPVLPGSASGRCSEPQCWKAVGMFVVGVARHMVEKWDLVAEQEPKKKIREPTLNIYCTSPLDIKACHGNRQALRNSTF